MQDQGLVALVADLPSDFGIKTRQIMNNKLLINAIVTKALLDSDFEASILNGKRKECLEMFKLDQAEKETILAIDADGIDQFIRQIDALTQPREKAFSLGSQVVQSTINPA